MCLASGTLAMSEILFQMQKSCLLEKSGAELARTASRAESRVSRAELKSVIRTAVRSSCIGVVIGALPGLGATMAAFMAGFMNLLAGSAGLRLFIRVMGIPWSILYPAVLYICIVGAYLVGSSVFGVGVMFCLALLGFFMHKFGYSFVTFLIDFVLAPAFELSLQRTLILSGDDPSVFVTRPLPLIMLAASVLPAFRTWRNARKKPKPAPDSENAPFSLD